MKNKVKVIACFNLEQVINLVGAMLRKYVDAKLLKRGYYAGNQDQPAVACEVAHDGFNTIFLRMKVRHDPFGASETVTEWKYYCLSSITEQAVTSQIFHALTWKAGPYYWGGEQFKKHMEVM